MQAKGLVKFFAIALVLVCLFQLSFTLKTYFVEKNAEEFAEQKVSGLRTQLSDLEKSRPMAYHDTISEVKKKFKQTYLDSISNENVYNLLVAKYTYEEIKDRQINLGLDLQGGMSVILEVSIHDMLESLAGTNSNNPAFRQAVELAKQKQKTREDDYVSLFIESFKEVAPNAKLAAIFANRQNQGLIEPDYTDEQVAEVLRSEAADAIDRTYEILSARIDQFGVTSPNISRIEASERIMIELPGVDNPSRVRKLLQSVAELEFWETYQANEVYDFFREADIILAEQLELERGLSPTPTPAPDTTFNNFNTTPDSVTALGDTSLYKDSTLASVDTSKEFSTFTDEQADIPDTGMVAQGKSPLLGMLNLLQGQAGPANVAGPTVAAVLPKDTSRVNSYLRIQEVRDVFPSDMRLLWGNKADKNTGLFNLYAIKANSADGKAPLTGEVVTDAFQDYDQSGRPNINIRMNSEGGSKWQRITAANAGRGYIAIVLDNLVYSSPFVKGEIPGGNTEISGDFTVKEAQDLANILKAGKLPAPAKIVQESQVGPTLGKESIQAGILSMVAGLVLVLLFMMFYYSRSGVISSLALIINIFFIFGILASLGATLTLPGIAGIVLTIGMAVDANVIIFERIREELLKGKGTRLAVVDGFRNSYSAIIDANVTTLITAFILAYFGLGPVLGFATVLIIGIFSSLFTAVLLSRLIFDWMLKKDMKVSLGNKMTLGAFSKLNINFLGSRKIAYTISGILIIASLASFFTRGFELGVDFKGGRAYEVSFPAAINSTEVRQALTTEFGQTPIVKTVGANNQLKITTSYLIDSTGTEVDSVVTTKLMAGLQSFYNEPMDYVAFQENYIRSYTKVEPTIADDIKRTSLYATFFALIAIFLYILVRFRKWQFSVGALGALAHDVIITLGVFSLLHGILPFSMEIDQTFIAAILTVIGYSINDTVIVFDRVREYLRENVKVPFMTNVNTAINTTISRTLITSGTTLLVIIVLFIFGGEVIRGFAFAILIGIGIGTYSSIYVATPILVDLSKEKNDPELESSATRRTEARSAIKK